MLDFVATEREAREANTGTVCTSTLWIKHGATSTMKENQSCCMYDTVLVPVDLAVSVSHPL